MLPLQIKDTKHFLSLVYFNRLFLIIAFTPPVIIESPERLAIIKNAGSRSYIRFAKKKAN